MTAIVTIFRLGFAACLSGATAGLLLVSMVFLASHSGEPLGAWTQSGPARLAELLSWAQFGLTLGIFVASWPAFAAGALLWGISRRSRTARRRLAWASAGAAVAALHWLLVEAISWTPARAAAIGFVDAAQLAACLLSGVVGALAFRAAMMFGEPPVRRVRVR